jgi:Spy/CpxP family protein refolding chaperone
MNKNHLFTASIQSIEASTDRFYREAAFGAIHFDGVGRRHAIQAAFAILEEAQAQCIERLMQTTEVQQACSYLSGQNGKVRPLAKRFWDGLAITDQHTRFEATSQALRVIRQQFAM